MRGMDLIEVARQCPDLTVSIRLGDLIEANQNLVEEALMRLEKSVAESRTEIYLSRTKVMEMLEVASATLWRWEKCGYLVPLSVGGKKRYRLSDIQRLLNRWCFIQQRDEKGKAQESIGSWAFPSCPVGAGHLPSNQKQDVRSSDKVLRSRQLSSSELGEKRVTSDMPRAHTPIYVFVRFCVHILMCSRINT